MLNNLKKNNTRINQNEISIEQKITSSEYDMVVFCHLRWQFVYQRPQHLISRMSKNMKILLIEEPISYSPEEKSSGSLMMISDNLHVLQPKVKDIESIADILPEYIKNKGTITGWFYSASFSPLLSALNFDIVIYDCMDELSLFKGAPKHLIDQEKYLMSHADIVFTGGKSLFESKKKLHPNVYCFPSSVDESHFAKAQNDIEIPADVSKLKEPVVGYYGVIDERIDLSLLHETAKLLPNTSFVMIGPLAKIEESDLPKENNIYYLGMRSYDELPNYLKIFDIAMMPFALNDATKYISPTKTLEYMAAGKPIISTKITDVVNDYSDCISLIETADEFAEAITSLYAKKDEQLCMPAEYYNILKNTSWDATVQRMQSIINTFAI
jgi:glycosyltransferase involved in cell wall biosynthesis